MFNKIKSFIKSEFLWRDLILTIIIMFILRSLLLKFLGIDIYCFLGENNNDLYSLYVTVGVALLGFLLAAIGLVIVFLSNSKLDIFEGSKHPKRIIKTYFSAIKYVGIFTIVTYAGILVPNIPVLATVISYLLIIVLVRLTRCIWLTEKLAELIYKT